MFGRKKKPQHLIIEVNRSDAKKPSQDEVRANKFVLTDKDGNTRAQLQCAAGGAVALTFHDNKEKMAMLLGLNPNQSPTLACVRDGKMRMNLDLDEKTHHPSVTLHGPGKSAVDVGFDDSDNASLSLKDKNGEVRALISLSSEGDAEVKLFDRKGYIKKSV